MEDDLIRRGDVIAQAYEFEDCNIETGEEIINSAVYVDDVLSIPPVDAAEVRHGRWARVDYEMVGHDYICSECGEKNDRASRWCPDCGARMDGRREEDA